MPRSDRNPTINLEDYVVEVLRFLDEPLQQGDQVLYTDRYSGRRLVARAPFQLVEV